MLRKHLRCDFFKRKPNKQYHTNNQREKYIVKISSILQPQKIPGGIRISFENHFPPTGNSKNRSLSTENLSKKDFFESFRKNFLMKVSGKSLSPENPEESFMLAKRSVSRKMGASMKEKLEKSRIEKTPVFKTKIGYRVLCLRKPNFRPNYSFWEISQCQKLKEGTLRDF